MPVIFETGIPFNWGLFFNAQICFSWFSGKGWLCLPAEGFSQHLCHVCPLGISDNKSAPSWPSTLGPLSLPQCSADWMKMCLQRLDILVTTVHFSAQKAISWSALHLWFIGRRVQTDNILAMWPWPLSTFVKASSEVRPNVCKQDVIKAGNWQGLTLRQCRAGREWPVRCQLALCSKCLHNN